MPDISISREQQAYIEALREELDDEMAYGHVRVQDAVQYLIDHHREDGDLDVEIEPGTPEEPPEDPETESDDEAENAEEGSDHDEEGEESSDPGGSGESTDPDPTEEGADDADDDASGDEPTATDATDGSGVDDAVAALGNAGPAGGSDPGGTESGSGEDGSTDGESTTSGGTATIGGADSDKVSEMMNLMDAHDDVWEETDSTEGKYSVELPDGGRETVQTKDDVRALLFKHYR